jgi:hypothetical protein
MGNASRLGSPLLPDSERIVRARGASVKETIANLTQFS